jgi:dimethyladenosine transferase 1
MDPRLLERVALAGGPLAGCHVVEVGPGPGGITRAILGQGAARCTVIEKDPRFLPSLHLLAEASGGRLEIHQGDALAFNMEQVSPAGLRRAWTDAPPDIRVLGNLPFNVSTPLIVRWLSDMASHTGVFSYGRVPLTLTFQQEVVDRMLAPPSATCRSRLSIMCQNWAAVQRNFTIPGAAFVPKPEVDVGVVTFTPLVKPYIDLPFPLVERVITTIFNGKQKFLENTLVNLFPKPMAKRFISQMLYEADLTGRGRRLRPIDLDMASLGLLCHSFQRIAERNPSLQKYSPSATKQLVLGPLVYEDGQIYTGEPGGSSLHSLPT